MVTSGTTQAGIKSKRVLLLLGANGNLGTKLLESTEDLLHKYTHIFCLDKVFNHDSLPYSDSSIQFMSCDAIKDDYISQIISHLGGKDLQLEALNLIAKDYPVMESGLSQQYTSPFAIDPNDYVESLAVTAGSSYHLIKQVIDLELLSTSLWLIGSIYDRVLPSPTLYSKDNSSISLLLTHLEKCPDHCEIKQRFI